MTSAFTQNPIEREITVAPIELPVFPQQEAQGHMRKWNISFQQELTVVFVTECRQQPKSWITNSETSIHLNNDAVCFQMRIWYWGTQHLEICTAMKVSSVNTKNWTESLKNSRKRYLAI